MEMSIFICITILTRNKTNKTYSNSKETGSWGGVRRMDFPILKASTPLTHTMNTYIMKKKQQRERMNGSK